MGRKRVLGEWGEKEVRGGEGDGLETSVQPEVDLSPSERRKAVEGKAGRGLRVRV